MSMNNPIQEPVGAAAGDAAPTTEAEPIFEASTTSEPGTKPAPPTDPERSTPTAADAANWARAAWPTAHRVTSARRRTVHSGPSIFADEPPKEDLEGEQQEPKAPALPEVMQAIVDAVLLSEGPVPISKAVPEGHDKLLAAVAELRHAHAITVTRARELLVAATDDLRAGHIQVTASGVHNARDAGGPASVAREVQHLQLVESLQRRIATEATSHKQGISIDLSRGPKVRGSSTDQSQAIRDAVAALVEKRAITVQPIATGADIVTIKPTDALLLGKLDLGLSHRSAPQRGQAGARQASTAPRNLGF